MLEINKKKLVPGIVATWGDITGNVENQEDLVEYIDNHTPEVVWGGITGDIADQEDLQEELSLLATKSELSGKQDTLESGVNIKTVNDQSLLGPGNITIEGGGEDNVIEVVKVNGTALTPDVNKAVDVIVPTKTSDLTNDSGYLTENNFKTINGESIVGSGDITAGGLTPEQEAAVDVIVNAGNGYLKHTSAVPIIGAWEAILTIDGRQQDLHTINGDVYLHRRDNGIFYKFNKQTYQFEEGPQTSEMPYQNEHLWTDSQGRVYSNNAYIVNLETGEYTYKDMGGDFQIHTGSNYTNIIEKDGVVYMISMNNSCAYIFNESTQEFDSSIPVQGTFPASNYNYYRYLSEFEDHWIYDGGSTQTELVFHLDAAEPYVEWVALSERLFPGAWSYEYEGQTINETTRGVYVHPVTINGVREYYTWGYRNPVMYKLINGAWEIVAFTMNVDGYNSNSSGVSIDDLWFGYGYVSGTNEIIMWNFGEAKGIPESYDWEQMKTINGESITGEGDIEIRELTSEEASSIEVLTNSSNGALYTNVFPGMSMKKDTSDYMTYLVNGIRDIGDGDVYFYNDQRFLKFNKNTLNWDLLGSEYIPNPVNAGLWKDSSGNFYDGPSYIIDLQTGQLIEVNTNCSNFLSNYGRTNILYGQYGVWNVNQYDLQKFDGWQFVSGYTLNLPTDYQDDLVYCMCTRFKYDGHILYESGIGKTYEIVESEDHIDVVDVTDMYYIRPSFGIQPQFIFGTDSGLFYMYNYDFYKYNKNNQSWEPFTQEEISDITRGSTFSTNYGVTGDFVVGGMWINFKEYTVINLGDEWKNTYWTDVKDIAVDLSSEQTITGYKTFAQGLRLDNGTLSVQNSSFGDGYINLGQYNTLINANKNVSIVVPGLFTLNDKDIAVTDQCILNRSYSYPGPRFNGVVGLNNMSLEYTYYFVTPSGRLIYNYPGDQVAYEFDGTQWVQLQSVTNFISSYTSRVELNDGLYAVNSNDVSLYKWDDTNSDWEFIIQVPDVNIWAADANTLRCSSNQKLVNNGGTYQWEEDWVNNYPGGEVRCAKLGQNYYYMSSNSVYTYDETQKTFTLMGNTYQSPDGYHWFTYDGCLYYLTSSTVRKVDPSQVGTYQWDTITDICYTSWNYVYVEYDNKIWTVKYNNSLGYNQLGYTYDVTESVPAVPAQDGTYVLKATVLNGQVTYSWVVEV